MTLRYIVMTAYAYDGLWPARVDGSEAEPLPSFATKDEAHAHAVSIGLISPKGRRNDAEILAVRVDA